MQAANFFASTSTELVRSTSAAETERPFLRSRRWVAFTLVELLVVVGIIAVLISILLPSLNRAHQAGQSVQCLSNLRQLYMGVQFYALDMHGYFPACPYGQYQYPVPRTLGRVSAGGRWIKDAKVWTCPADVTTEKNQYPGGYADQFLPVANISYAYNQTAGMYDNQSSAPANYFVGYRPEKSKTTAYDAIFFDVESGTASSNNLTYMFCYGRLDLTPGWGSGQTQSQLYSGRHNGNRTLNVVGGDGHAEGVNLRDIYDRIVPQAQDPQGRSVNAQVRAMLQPWQTYVTGNTHAQWRSSGP